MESRLNTISSITNNNLLCRYNSGQRLQYHTNIIFYIIIFVQLSVFAFVQEQTPKCMRCTLLVCVMGFVDGWWWDEQQVVDTGSRTTGSGRMSTTFECVRMYIVIIIGIFGTIHYLLLQSYNYCIILIMRSH